MDAVNNARPTRAIHLLAQLRGPAGYQHPFFRRAVHRALGLADEAGLFQPGAVSPSPLGPWCSGSPASDTLNDEQQRAHDYVVGHLQQTLAGALPKQLLMIVHGPCGAGKTVLLNTLARTFERLDSLHILARLAPSAEAADLIAGCTTYHWAGTAPPFPVLPFVGDADSPSPSAERGVRYVFIDHYTLMSERDLEGLSATIPLLLGLTPNGQPFGGVNVILFGDPYDLKTKGSSAFQAAGERRVLDAFQQVAVLARAMRTQDGPWRALLSRARKGRCTAADITLLSGLILRPGQPAPAWINWRYATFIAPCTGVAAAWNKRAVQRLCTETGARLFSSPAFDVDALTGAALSDEILDELSSAPSRLTGYLPSYVDIVEGMRLVAHFSGRMSLGTLVAIEVDRRDRNLAAHMALRRPPRALHFRAAGESDVTTLSPVWTEFRWLRPNQSAVNVRRTQYRFVPAYAMSDVRASGYTFDYVIADFAGRSECSLQSVYSVLSRVTSPDRVRILGEFDTSVLTAGASARASEADREIRRRAERGVWPKLS